VPKATNNNTSNQEKDKGGRKRRAETRLKAKEEAEEEDGEPSEPGKTKKEERNNAVKQKLTCQSDKAKGDDAPASNGSQLFQCPWNTLSGGA
jgi:hypothetical protein